MRAGAAAAAAGAAVAEGPPSAELAASLADESARTVADSALSNEPDSEATGNDTGKIPSSTKRKNREGSKTVDGKVALLKERARVAMRDESDAENVLAPRTPAKTIAGIRTRSRARIA